MTVTRRPPACLKSKPLPLTHPQLTLSSATRPQDQNRMHHRTRYPFPLSPSPANPSLESNSKEKLGLLIESGMNIARLNFAHCTHSFASSVISNIRAYLSENQISTGVGIWCDINGPKVRTGRVTNGSVQLTKGQEFWFINDPETIGISPPPSIPFLNVRLNIE